MNLFRFRTLEAPANPLHAAYTVATGRTVQDAVGDSNGAPAWIPAPEYPEIWAALAAAGNSAGVIDHTNPALTDPARD
jgi:hypothetical protein